MLPSISRRIFKGFVVSAALTSWSAADAAGGALFTTTPPTDFQQLDQARELIVDLVFRGRRLDQVTIVVEQGRVRFADPATVATLVPEARSVQDLRTALSGSFNSNADLACGSRQGSDCGFLDTSTVGLILDEDRFRVDLFVGPTHVLERKRPAPEYLSAPALAPSFVSRYGLTLTGDRLNDPDLHFQNRSVLSIAGGRVRADLALATTFGFAVDGLAVERDRGDSRAVAGLFWSPGGDFIGRRKLVGIGMASQLDTRLDGHAVLASPLTVVLSDAGRIDILVDGRVVHSRTYSAGEAILDTASLPDGSYDVVLEIREGGRTPRTERRFFTKGSGTAPMGRPLFSASVGFLADAKGRPQFSQPYYQAAVAARMTQAIELSGRLFGTTGKAVVEGGVQFLSQPFRARFSGLASTAGDIGAVVRVASSQIGPVSLNFDLRTVKSAGNRPLLPFSERSRSFLDDAEQRIGDNGSYTQGSLFLTSRVRDILVRLSGTYRKRVGDGADYAIGLSADAPLVRAAGRNWWLVAEIRKTDRDLATMLGFRVLSSGPAVTFGASGAMRNGNGPRGVSGETYATVHRTFGQSDASGTVTAGRDEGSTYGRVAGHFASPLVEARADVLHQFGKRGATHFSGTVDGALVLGDGFIMAGARDVHEGAIIIRASGTEARQQFEILVDNVVRGITNANRPRLLFLPSYRRYEVRVRPVGGGIVDYDSKIKVADVHPGTVAGLDFSFVPATILFGRAINETGAAIANAIVRAGEEQGHTDDNGYFQISLASVDKVLLTVPGGASCQLAMPLAMPTAGASFINAGAIPCLVHS